VARGGRSKLKMECDVTYKIETEIRVRGQRKGNDRGNDDIFLEISRKISPSNVHLSSRSAGTVYISV